jgi:hypothetical protein
MACNYHTDLFLTHHHQGAHPTRLQNEGQAGYYRSKSTFFCRMSRGDLRVKYLPPPPQRSKWRPPLVKGSSSRVLALGQPGVPGGEGTEDTDKQEIANQDAGKAHCKAWGVGIISIRDMATSCVSVNPDPDILLIRNQCRNLL